MRTSDLGAEENIQGMEALITGPSVNKHECRSEDVGDILSAPSTRYAVFQTWVKMWNGPKSVYRVKRAYMGD